MKIRLFLTLLTLTLTLCACSASTITIDGYEASFRGHMVELDGECAALADIYPGENYLKLFDDGRGAIAFSGEEEEITWMFDGEKYSITFQGEESSAQFENGILTMELDGGIVTYIADGAAAPEIPTISPSEYDTDLSVAYGKYHGLTISDITTTEDMREFYGGDCYIRLDKIGLGVLSLGGGEMTIAWELNGTELTIADSNGINSIGYLSNGVIVLDYMESGIQLAFAKEGANP